MSLPKRDGVQGRYYLIQKPDTNPEVLEHADQCFPDVFALIERDLRQCKFDSAAMKTVEAPDGKI